MIKSTEKILIRDIFKEPEKFLSGHYFPKAKKISVSGWVRTIRATNDVGFIEINDGTFLKNLQAVFENRLDCG